MEMKYGLVGVVLNFVVAILVPVLLGNFHSRSLKSFGVMALHMAGCCALMTGLCALYYFFGGSVAMPQVCGGIVSVMYAIFFCRFAVKTRVMMCLSFFSVNANVFVACFSIGDLLTAAGTEGDQIIVVMLSAILMTACVLFFRAFSVVTCDDVPVVSVVLVGAVGIANVVFWILTNVTQLEGTLKIVIAGVLIVLLLFAYYSAFAISANLSATHKRRAEQLMRETDAHMLRMSENNLEAMRRLRHELKNQYAYMSLLLEKGDYERLAAYFAEYAGKLNETMSFVDCGNEVVSAVLNIAQERAKQAAARLDYVVKVPAVMKIADADMCSILLNLISNAVEYLQRRPDIGDRTVDIRLEMINRTLLIAVGNALDDADKTSALLLRTSKRDKELHGYGSKVVRGIADKYNGSLSYEAENGRFVVTAMLAEED